MGNNDKLAPNLTSRDTNYGCLWILFFWICVQIIIKVSAVLGITYQQLNVILFVILYPAITLLFFILFLNL